MEISYFVVAYSKYMNFNNDVTHCTHLWIHTYLYSIISSWFSMKCSHQVFDEFQHMNRISIRFISVSPDGFFWFTIIIFKVEIFNLQQFEGSAFLSILLWRKKILIILENIWAFSSVRPKPKSNFSIRAEIFFPKPKLSVSNFSHISHFFLGDLSFWKFEDKSRSSKKSENI